MLVQLILLLTAMHNTKTFTKQHGDICAYTQRQSTNTVVQ
jgi:hypothetical protein